MVRAGWLSKRAVSGMLRVWRRRYIVLTSKYIAWYRSDAPGTVAAGWLWLQPNGVAHPLPEPHCWELLVFDARLATRCDSTEEQQAWLRDVKAQLAKVKARPAAASRPFGSTELQYSPADEPPPLGGSVGGGAAAAGAATTHPDPPPPRSTPVLTLNSLAIVTATPRLAPLTARAHLSRPPVAPTCCAHLLRPPVAPTCRAHLSRQAAKDRLPRGPRRGRLASPAVARSARPPATARNPPR